jgi:hypothetical protein
MTSRRKAAGFVLLIGALFVGAKLMGASERLVPATIVYKLPAGATELESEARPVGKDLVVARFVAAHFEDAHELRQPTHLPPGSLELTITLTRAAGATTLHRRVEVARDALVTVDLAATW